MQRPLARPTTLSKCALQRRARPHARVRRRRVRAGGLRSQNNNGVPITCEPRYTEENGRDVTKRQRSGWHRRSLSSACMSCASTSTRSACLAGPPIRTDRGLRGSPFPSSAESVGNVEHRLHGTTDSPLTPHGQRQAAAVAAHLASVQVTALFPTRPAAHGRLPGGS